MKRTLVLLAVAVVLGGCSKPNAANIQLRRENHDLRSKLESIERAREADQATIRAMESRGGATTVPVLPNERLAQLFTVHGLQFGRLTGGADFDPNATGQEGMKAYVVPTDVQGQPIKAAGSFVVEAFDLANGDNARLGRWEFGVDQAAQNWFGQAMLYTYVLPLPWQGQRPAHDEVTLRVSFTDALTQRTFNAQRVVHVQSSR